MRAKRTRSLVIEREPFEHRVHVVATVPRVWPFVRAQHEPKVIGPQKVLGHVRAEDGSDVAAVVWLKPMLTGRV